MCRFPPRPRRKSGWIWSAWKEVAAASQAEMHCGTRWRLGLKPVAVCDMPVGTGARDATAHPPAVARLLSEGRVRPGGACGSTRRPAGRGLRWRARRRGVRQRVGRGGALGSTRVRKGTTARWRRRPFLVVTVAVSEAVHSGDAPRGVRGLMVLLGVRHEGASGPSSLGREVAAHLVRARHGALQGPG